MQQGRGGMGSHKHGVSGRAGKSPKMRLWQRMEAERAKPKRRRPTTKFHTSIKDALREK